MDGTEEAAVVTQFNVFLMSRSQLRTPHLSSKRLTAVGGYSRRPRHY